MKTIRFYDEVYLVTYYVTIGGSAKDFKNKLKRHNVKFGKIEPTDYAYFVGKESKRSMFGFIYCQSYDQILLAHECLHAVSWVFDKVGLPMTKKCDEAMTYYQQFLLTKIKEKFNK